MPAIKKRKNNISYGGGAIVNSDVKSYANDPVIVKKNDEAKIDVSRLILPQTDGYPLTLEPYRRKGSQKSGRT